MFKKILVANRGEIAIRIMRACKEMNIVPVAVYSDCDRTALHVSHAYESYHIGPSPSSESYLAMEKIIDAAKKSGAEAVHPGYGFLSENADFAEACASEGLTFIGPPPAAIRLMGDKLEARSRMRASGLPVIPGSEGAVSSSDEASAIASSIGYPVIIKAAAGGGGKGMRIVEKGEDFSEALKMTMGEAENAFGNAAVYIEKFIRRPRHIEVQIMADGYGNVVSLGERECSMQRRYQKVIEETPSPALDGSLRREIQEAAIKAAEAVGYVGAGTIEFIFQDGKFYFLEMNTRLQVEHPVTEMVFGCDIVKEMIRVAAGEKLGISQADVRPRGWAIEMRIYAEDPMHDFMPAAGMVKRLSLPQGPGVRNENGIYEGYEIPVYYDPLIGKVVVWATDRSEAISRAKRALREYQLDGVRTNLDFLLWALSEEGFVAGDYDTRYIEEHFDPSLLHHRQEEIELATIAACIAAYNNIKEGVYHAPDEDHDDAWKRAARNEGLRAPLAHSCWSLHSKKEQGSS
jgi:acetyl-CoA carboxylase biotin carboxylase subunit